MRGGRARPTLEHIFSFVTVLYILPCFYHVLSVVLPLLEGLWRREKGEPIYDG